MQVKTPEQLEDAAIADAIRSVVALKVRREQRELQNRLTEQVQKKVDLARLNGERVNIQAFVKEVVSAVADA
jgi:hypothetical protein